MRRAGPTKRLGLAQQVSKQIQWMVEHGNTLAGYVTRYGSASDPEHYGEGGEAIYAADAAELQKLLARASSAGVYQRPV